MLSGRDDRSRVEADEARWLEALHRFRADCDTMSGGLEELCRMRGAEIESDDPLDKELSRKNNATLGVRELRQCSAAGVHIAM